MRLEVTFAALLWELIIISKNNNWRKDSFDFIGKFDTVLEPMSKRNFSTTQLHYALHKIKHSDWPKEDQWLGTSNQSTLFRCSYGMLKSVYNISPWIGSLQLSWNRKRFAKSDATFWRRRRWCTTSCARSWTSPPSSTATWRTRPWSLCSQLKVPSSDSSYTP